MKILTSFALLLTVSFISAFSMRGLENYTLKQQQFKTAGNFSRITNGHTANPGQFPYVVGVLLYENGDYGICGGSLINREWVLTAAHCTIDASSVYIYLGQVILQEPHATLHKPTDYIKEHEDYNRTTFHHDIALIKIHPPDFSPVVHDIRLPSNIGNHQSYAGLNGFIAGWGTTSDSEPNKHPHTLQYAKLPIIANFQCSEVISQEYIYDGKMCTAAPNKISGCHGDSGGPLVLEGGNFQIGIISIGAQKCEDGHPNLFTRVDHYLQWIHDKMRAMG